MTESSVSSSDYLELLLLRFALTHQTKSPAAIKQLCREHGAVPNDGEILATQRRVRAMLDNYARGMPDDEEEA